MSPSFRQIVRKTNHHLHQRNNSKKVVSSNNNNIITDQSSAAAGIPWQRALRAFRHQLFAGQELTPDLAQRVTSIFERQGDAADLLRWWILFRCEKVPPTVSEARALLKHNMWKQALYTSVISSIPVAGEENNNGNNNTDNNNNNSTATSLETYTEYGKHAAVATCRSGNWKLALQLCQTWEAKIAESSSSSNQIIGESSDNNNSSENKDEEKEFIPSSSSTSSAFLDAVGKSPVKKRQLQEEITIGDDKDEKEEKTISQNLMMNRRVLDEFESRKKNVPSWAIALNAMFMSVTTATENRGRSEQRGSGGE